LGLDDAQSLEVIEQGIIYIDIVFGGLGGWVMFSYCYLAAEPKYTDF